MSNLKVTLSDEGKKLVAELHESLDELHGKFDEYKRTHANALYWCLGSLAFGIAFGLWLAKHI